MMATMWKEFVQIVTNSATLQIIKIGMGFSRDKKCIFSDPGIGIE